MLLHSPMFTYPHADCPSCSVFLKTPGGGGMVGLFIAACSFNFYVLFLV